MIALSYAQKLHRPPTGELVIENSANQIRQPLRPEYFPLDARGREIVTRDGFIIATIAEPAMAEEIAQRLNETEWKRQEDQWAL
jgi:hypothetical protein